jgi:hypothetical protein
MGVSRRAYRGLVEKPERKRQLGKPRLRREENIKMYLTNSVEAVNINTAIIIFIC